MILKTVLQILQTKFEEIINFNPTFLNNLNYNVFKKKLLNILLRMEVEL